MFQTSKARAAAIAVVALSAGMVFGVGSPALAAGNSDNAKACQKGGWQTYVREDQTTFKNQGACVSYAARGGTLTFAGGPQSDAEVACIAAGGTFGSEDLVLPGEVTVIWSCNGVALSAVNTLDQLCFAEDINYSFSWNSFIDPTNTTCWAAPV